MHNASVLLKLTRPPLYWFLHWSRSTAVQLSVQPQASRKYPIMSVCALLYHSHSIWAASSFVSAWWVVTALGVMSFVVCSGILCVAVFTRVSRELFVAPRQRRAGGWGWGSIMSFHTKYHTALNEWPGQSLSLKWLKASWFDTCVVIFSVCVYQFLPLLTADGWGGNNLRNALRKFLQI